MHDFSIFPYAPHQLQQILSHYLFADHNATNYLLSFRPNCISVIHRKIAKSSNLRIAFLLDAAHILASLNVFHIWFVCPIHDSNLGTTIMYVGKGLWQRPQSWCCNFCGVNCGQRGRRHSVWRIHEMVVVSAYDICSMPSATCTKCTWMVNAIHHSWLIIM